MFNRWIEEDGLLDMLEEVGVGCIAFSPLAQGMLTDRYLDGVPEDSRAAQGKSLDPSAHRGEPGARARAQRDRRAPRPDAGADRPGLGAARPAGDVRAVGASSVRQLETNLGALDGLAFTDDELAAIDQHAVDAGINLWEQSSLS